MDRCSKCGYDLRGLPHHRCPECGCPIETKSPPVLGVTVAAIMAGLMGAILQAMAIWYVVAGAGHGGSLWPAILFFGPLGLYPLLAMLVGFLLYPGYVWLIARSRRPGWCGAAIFAGHYVCAALGIAMQYVFGVTWDDNVASITQYGTPAMALSAILFVTAHGLVGWVAFRMRRRGP
jgi:hypothetical protein